MLSGTGRPVCGIALAVRCPPGVGASFLIEPLEPLERPTPCSGSHKSLVRYYFGSSDFCVGQNSRISVKAATVEVDGDLEVIRISVATGPLLDRANLGIQPFGNGIGDAMFEVGQHIWQVAGDQPGYANHGRLATWCPRGISVLSERIPDPSPK